MILAPWVTAQAQDAREEGPREIEKCQTIDKPGSYKLVNNLTFSATTGACLPITASFVTIDLAGFTMTGNGIATEAIVATPPSGQVLDGIAVRNGSISGFAGGVDLVRGDSSVVEGLRVFGSVPSTLGIGANGIVKGNIVERVAGPAGARGVGIFATGIVTGNSIASQIGMEIGQGSTVIGNSVRAGPFPAVTVTCPSNLTDNTFLNIAGGETLGLIGDGCHSEDNVAP
jgi:hypothetical protein